VTLSKFYNTANKSEAIWRLTKKKSLNGYSPFVFVGDTQTGSLEILGSEVEFVVRVGGYSGLRTSLIKAVTETKSGYRITTLNSIYALQKISKA
jgi:hypothetical protein